MREYRKKMEEQKRLREKILREKENRRKMAAMEKQNKQINKMETNVTGKYNFFLLSLSFFFSFPSSSPFLYTTKVNIYEKKYIVVSYLIGTECTQQEAKPVSVLLGVVKDAVPNKGRPGIGRGRGRVINTQATEVQH